ncbi:hypothetical protein LEP1GSC008_2599 [Leptospira kirschneri serovar Bulgarica str. Nikolaevo]|uniref:Uncharacterized protein n=1 Tax=Leptospira kirschneri serovar Bulgarica str. Nikolaevo TaxID=1240687 RepID=M6F251_9LEPT|nr:hypothetical protein LEP1GSC008_2599 [Leptospira kirschneri serovar Bulgarica str. Nikolaevo]
MFPICNLLTRAKEPGPACSIESFFYRLLAGFARILKRQTRVSL